MYQALFYVLGLQCGPYPQALTPSLAASTSVRSKCARNQLTLKQSLVENLNNLGIGMGMRGTGVWEGIENVTVFIIAYWLITQSKPITQPIPISSLFHLLPSLKSRF